MKFPVKKIISLFCLSIFLLTACSKNENANLSAQANQSTGNIDEKNNAQTIKDDAEELGKIIKLPLMPEEATWREDNLSAQTGKKLTAVLRFSAEDAGKIAEQAEKYKPATASVTDAETWFPAELVAQSQLSGDESLKGATFAANDFFQPPYENGRITRINNTNYFVLELTAP